MKFWITGVVLSLAVAHPAWADAPIIDAAKAGDDANVAALLKAGTDVNTRAADGATALEWAVYRNDVDLAKRLIRAGADVKLANNYGATPMSLAATTANVEMLKLLLDAGADVESPNADGQTALMIAHLPGESKKRKRAREESVRVLEAYEAKRGQQAAPQ